MTEVFMASSTSDLDHSQRSLNEAIAEYYREIELGSGFDRSAFVAKYPGLATQIKAFLLTVLEFEHDLKAAQSQPIHSLTTLGRGRARDGLEKDSQGAEWSLGRLKKQEFPIDFGDYVLLSEIDRGGMGIVFKAKHKSLPRTVALKVIRSGEFASESELQRFRVEAEAIATVKHANIVPIFEFGEVCGLIYFTMEYVDGCDLSTALRDREFTPREAVRMLIKIADAVSTAHRLGIIHRDLKPSNILVDRNGEPYLIDFGLAKRTVQDSEVTWSGQILGTAAYMSPEQANGKAEFTPQVDVYSLGAVLYCAVTGQPPFTGESTLEILLQVVHSEPPSARQINKSVSRALDRLIVRAMARNPKDRYPTAEALKVDLQHLLMDEPIAWPKQSLSERLMTWWRRETVLVSHLAGIIATLAVVLASTDTWFPPLRIGILFGWILGSWFFQSISNTQSCRAFAHLSWVAFDIAIYTLLIYLAETPRGLLLIGYPLMICATGLFYRTRYVVFATTLSLLGFISLLYTVNDPICSRIDFALIYVAGICLVGFCMISMIQRVRSLTDYHQN